MHQLHIIDLTVLVLYIGGVVGFGAFYARRSKTVAQFTSAAGRIPGWAVGLSLFGTFLSSLTFLGVPGKAYGGNWNAFVFSITLPIAALVAVKYFVPFYRSSNAISAYTHLEERFGPWARTYAMLCYLLNQIARIGAILFGVALVLKTLLGWDMSTVIIVTGALVIFYTLLGGIEAVIWTDVVQSIVLVTGAALSLGIMVFTMPEGPGQIIAIAHEHQKFSLGDFSFSLTESTVLVVFMFGIFINLTNFGIDQDQVQRYHVAKSDKDASRAVWIMALLYVPMSLLFFLIGTSLFAYYQVHPDLLDEISRQVAAEQLNIDLGRDLSVTQAENIQKVAATLSPADIGDRVFPHFIVNQLPRGIVGLLIAALLAAAMSSIDTSLNCSATIILKDFYGRHIQRNPSERTAMRVLHGATIVWGILGTSVAIMLIGVRSLLDAWWIISGIFSGGMLGLFLLGFISKRAGSFSAATGVVIGLLVIVWMTLSPSELWPEQLAFMRSPFHASMVTVIGTMSIFLVGTFVSRVTETMAHPRN
ncbi:MAG: sodium:solute symporter [Candidatus Hydrogenedentota bacterium]|nr:MAG: sodium:solute symporter [Candidatus Hydrogenedentota bacterium]